MQVWGFGAWGGREGRDLSSNLRRAVDEERGKWLGYEYEEEALNE